MLIQPTRQDLARDRNATPLLVVDTWSDTRVLHPNESPEFSAEAFTAAHAEASAANYDTIAFVRVTEFYQTRPGGIPAYRYVWEFSTHPR